MSDPILTTGEYITAIVTGGLAIIGTVSATLHKLGIVQLQSPFTRKSNNQSKPEVIDNSNPGIPAWCADLRKSCTDNHNRNFGVITQSLGRIESNQVEQTTRIDKVRNEVTQIVSAYREKNGKT